MFLGRERNKNDIIELDHPFWWTDLFLKNWGLKTKTYHIQVCSKKLTVGSKDGSLGGIQLNLGK